jgi:hypothetical protein
MPGRLLLIVDDNPIVRQALWGLFTSAGPPFDSDNIAASAWNTGIRFRNRFVFVRATEEKPGICPSGGIVH